MVGKSDLHKESDYLEVVYHQQKSYLEVLFSIPGVPIEKKTVKGGGLLYAGYLQILNQQIKLFIIIGVRSG